MKTNETKTNKEGGRVPEQIGRKFTATRWGLHTRKVGGDGTWYGLNHYKTEAEAMAALRKASKYTRVENVGGIGVDFGPDTGERYERRVVKVEMEYEVLAVGVGPM